MMTVATIPPLEVASDSWVCVRSEVYNQLVNSTLDWYYNKS